jgi:hypothetical protein
MRSIKPKDKLSYRDVNVRVKQQIQMRQAMKKESFFDLDFGRNQEEAKERVNTKRGFRRLFK